MLTTRSRIEVLQAAAEGGPITDENRTNFGYMKAVLNYIRGMAIGELYKVENILDDNLYQTISLTTDDIIQEDECWNLFSIPQIQAVNTQVNGIGYVGSVRQDKSWRYVKNLAQWSNELAKDVGGDKRTAVYYMIEPQEGYLRVFDTSVKRAFVQAVFVNPFDERLNFNEETDMYPITDQLFGMVEKYIRTGMLRDMLRVIPNSVSNSASDKPQTEVSQ